MTKDERRIIAENHNEFMKDNYEDNTDFSYRNSKIYDEFLFHDRPIIENNNTEIQVVDMTTEKAVATYGDLGCTVLNFASFTRPGGGFIKGSIAQEEAICHASNLYNVLEKFTTLYNINYKYAHRMNYGLYINWAIYSPGITFVYNENKTNEYDIQANVITCAAPNLNSFSKFTINGNRTEMYINTMKSRIKYILDIASDNNVNTLILGAFGCGVFGNDPIFVASCFKEALQYYNFNKVIFAIPSGPNGNYDAFVKVIKAAN